MKKLSKIVILLLIIGLLSGGVTQVLAGAANSNLSIPTVINGYSVPKEIGGLPVIFVHTSDNTRGMQPGEARLVLLDVADILQKSNADITVGKYLNEHPLPEGWLVYIICGKNRSQAEYAKEVAASNALYDKYGPLPTSCPISSANTEGTIGQQKAGTNVAKAVDQNLDPQTMTVTSQSVQWNAPTVGSNQNAYSLLLNNGWTNMGFLFQVGQEYHNYGGRNVWVSSTNSCGYCTNLFLKDGMDAVPYIVGHKYYYSISYNSSTTYWTLYALDITAMRGQGVLIGSAGSRLIACADTGVYFENVNTNANWYTGFTNPIIVGEAFDRDYQCWLTDARYQTYLTGGQWPLNGAIVGNLVNFHKASFYLNKINLAK